MASTVTRRVTGVDVYAWSTPDETGPPGARQYHRANRGDVIEVTEAEAARGDELGFLGGEDDDAGELAPSSSAWPTEEVELSAGLSLPDGTPGPNAPSREAVDAAAAVAASIAALDESGVTDEELAAMSAADVVAHLNQNPGDVDRVEAIEAERNTPRSTVTKAVEAHRAAADEQ